MGRFNCRFCGKVFQNKHSNARYCRRSCSAQDHRDILKEKCPRRRYTDAELLALLVEKANTLGRPITRRDMVSPDESTYRQRFGSFRAALLLVGLTLTRPLPPSLYVADRIWVTA